MTQVEVYGLLTQSKGTWMSARKLSGLLKVNVASIQTSLRKLYDFGILERRKNSQGIGFVYRVPLTKKVSKAKEFKP